jgi:hypothetical protein
VVSSQQSIAIHYSQQSIAIDYSQQSIAIHYVTVLSLFYAAYRMTLWMNVESFQYWNFLDQEI